jgi:hypothetical protein
MKFKRFTKPQFLKSIGRTLLDKLFGKYSGDLATVGKELPAQGAKDDDYFKSLSGVAMGADGLPDDLFEAMYAIEEMANEEGQERLENAPACFFLIRGEHVPDVEGILGLLGCQLRDLRAFGQIPHKIIRELLGPAIAGIGRKGLHLTPAGSVPRHAIGNPPLTRAINLGQNPVAVLNLLGPFHNVRLSRFGRFLCRKCVGDSKSLIFPNKIGSRGRARTGFTASVIE